MARFPRQFRYAAILAAVASLSLTACGGSGNTSGNAAAGGASSSEGTTDVRFLSYVGTTAWPAYIADKQGIFAKNHIHPVFTSLPAGTQAVNAMLGGALDVVILDPNNAAPLLAQGQDLKMIYGLSNNYWSLLTDQGHEKSSLGDFVTSEKGQQIGAPSVGGGGALLYQYLASQYGLAKTDNKIVADLSGAALLSKSISAYMSDPGLACSLATQGAVEQTSFLRKPSDYSTLPANVQKLYDLPSLSYWVYGQWAQQNKSVVANLQKALGEAIAYVTDGKNLDTVTKTLRASSFNYPALNDSQFSGCVKKLVPGFEGSFPDSAVKTWSDIVRAEGIAPNGLPARDKFIDAGVPTS